MKYFLPTSLLIVLLSLLFSCSSDSEEPAPEPDTIAPQVDFSIAGNKSSNTGEPVVVSNQIEISIDAKDSGGIAIVEAFIDDQKVGEDTTAPYQIIIDVSSYKSKQSLTNKFTDYTLKVTVTDTSGNETSKDQIIHIDNELPSITEVSLADGEVLGGDINPITFNVSDNEGLANVTVLLNNELLSEIIDTSYEINLNTLNLADGENSLKIEAIDLADNKATHEIIFVADNTGPEITLESLVENQIVDETILLLPGVADEYSDVASVEFLMGEDSQTVIEGQAAYQWELDPETFPTGTASIFIKAVDNLNNETIAEFPIEILRRLVKVKISQGFLRDNWSSFWVIISNHDGSLIAHKSMGVSDLETVFHASGEFGKSQKYMITLLSVSNMGTYERNKLTNLQDLTRETFTEINLTAPEADVRQSTTLNAEGFGINQWEQITGFGTGYYVSHYTAPDNYINVVDNYLDSVDHEFYYTYSHNLEGIPYAYYKIPNSVQNGETLRKEDFISDIDITNSGFTIPGINPIEDNSIWLDIFAYNSELDFENIIYQQIFGNYLLRGFGDEYPYQLNNSFNNYAHFIRINEYSSFRKGTPLDSYELPNWSIGYSRNDTEFSLNITGTEHTLGRLYLSSGNTDGYNMTVLFDSHRDDPVRLPDFPEEMSELDIYQLANGAGLQEQQIQLTSLSNISSYNEYLDTYIKFKKEHHMSAEIIENLIYDKGSYDRIYNFNFNH